MTFTDKQMDVFRGQREVTELVPERVSFDGRGGSPELTKVYQKAMDIAEAVGHSTVDIAHVLLSFTLISEGIPRLREVDLDEVTLRRNCWSSLALVPAQADPHAVAFSSEVLAVNAMASAFAKDNDLNARMVQMRHVLVAIKDPRFNDTVGPLLSGTRSAPTLEEVRGNVESIKHYLEEQFPIAVGTLSALPASVERAVQSAVDPSGNDRHLAVRATLRQLLEELNGKLLDGRAWGERSCATSSFSQSVPLQSAH